MLLAIKIEEKEHGMEITTRCIHCKIEDVHTITHNQWYEWQIQGKFIQEVFPEWTPEQRDHLLNGTHPECWAKMFPETEEDN